MDRYSQWYEAVLESRPDGSFTVSVVHFGGYEFLHEAYDFLIQWMDQNGYRFKAVNPLGEKENIKEIYLIDSHNAMKKEEFQTKLEAEIIACEGGKK